MLPLSSCFFFFSSRRRHTRWPRDWSSDVCSSDLAAIVRDVGLWKPSGRLSEEEKAAIEAIKRQSAARQRSEERRVGKECRSRWWAEHENKKERATETDGGRERMSDTRG